MFSKITMRLTKIYFKICNMYCNTQYFWDDKEDTLEIRRGARRLGFYFAYYQTIFYLCFLFFRLIHLIQSGGGGFVSSAWITIWLNFYIWGVITYHNGGKNKWGTVALFKGLLKINREFQSGKPMVKILHISKVFILKEMVE
jgi:hypothetical protein